MTDSGIPSTEIVVTEVVRESAQTPFQRFLSDYVESPVAVVSFVVVLVVVTIALFAPFLAPTNPYDLATVTVADKTLAPGSHGFRPGGLSRDRWVGAGSSQRYLLRAANQSHVGIGAALLRWLSGSLLA
ncbi:MAG: hypothetical protein CM1200mP20_04680 [Pseudomonadota bacterium]|nr:MAG: hypothetical protein CM1200mP20_04680 [Pseudomonadota bacterium]